VFLTMGVQLSSIVADVERDAASVGTAVLVAACALALAVLVRAAYVSSLLGVLAVRTKRSGAIRTRVLGLRERIGTPEGKREALAEPGSRRRPPSERELDRFAARITRILADLDYFRREALGWREGTAVVWAGMRGAVTVAAAQTLPENAPQRPVLVLIAFVVALLSLLVQGGTVGPLVRRLAVRADRTAIAERIADERTRIAEIMRSGGEVLPEPPRPEVGVAPDGLDAAKERRLATIERQRSALLDARDNGTFDADVLQDALADLDAAQIAIEMAERPVDLDT